MDSIKGFTDQSVFRAGAMITQHRVLREQRRPRDFALPMNREPASVADPRSSSSSQDRNLALGERRFATGNVRH